MTVGVRARLAILGPWFSWRSPPPPPHPPPYCCPYPCPYCTLPLLTTAKPRGAARRGATRAGPGACTCRSRARLGVRRCHVGSEEAQEQRRVWTARLLIVYQVTQRVAAAARAGRGQSGQPSPRGGEDCPGAPEPGEATPLRQAAAGAAVRDVSA